MQYMTLTQAGREDMLQSLASMRSFLTESFGSLTEVALRSPGPEGTFSPVEQVWHLADLEREGFGERIRRLRDEAEPKLPDFDGARIAVERDYKSLSFADGLRAFGSARAANLEAFRTLADEAWARSGTQDGLGAVSLCDMPELMRQHDEAHKAEIRDWKRSHGAA